MSAVPYCDRENHSRHNAINAVFHRTLNFLTASSLLLAFNSSMVIAFGYLLYGSAVIPSLLLASFLVTFAVYGLNKVTDKAEDSINKPDLVTKRTDYYLILSIASMATGLLIGLSEGLLAFILLAMPFFIGLVYSIKISKNMPRLKEITGGKSIAVAVSWGLSGCLLSAIGDFNWQKTIFFFFFIALKVFVGAVLFDVLDINGDGALGVQMIPIKLGLDTTRKLLIVMNSLLLFLSGYCLVSGLLIEFMPVFVFGAVYGYLAIWWFYNKRCSRCTAGLMLDGEWLPMVMIAALLLT